MPMPRRAQERHGHRGGQAQSVSPSAARRVCIEKVAGRPFAPPAKNPVMDQKPDLHSPPLARAGGFDRDFPNSDTVRHNVFPGQIAKPFNLGTYPAGEVKQLAFDKEVCGAAVQCARRNVRLRRGAAEPYFALTDKDGAATLRNVPEGEYTLTFWHEDLKSVSKPIKVTQQQITEVSSRTSPENKLRHVAPSIRDSLMATSRPMHTQVCRPDAGWEQS